MIVATPIVDEEVSSKIYDVDSVRDRLNRAMLFCEYLDGQWRAAHFTDCPFRWDRVSDYLKRDITRVRRIIERRS
jgi:hypothetical protein